MLRSIAARRGRRCFAGQRALRCVSKHEGGSQSLVPILRDARTRPRSLRKFSGMRAPQDEDEHRVLQSSPYKQPFSFPRRIFAPEVLHPCFTHPRVEGWAERRETFGCSAELPGGLHVTRQARRLARRLASHDAGRSPLGAPPWRFWASGPRFRLLRRPPPYSGGQLPSDPCSELLAARS